MSKQKKYTKYDKYRELITKIIRQGDTFGVDKITDVPKACESMNCKDCLLYNNPHSCVFERKAWLDSKYEEPKRVFTDKQKNFIRTCDKIKYIARDKGGSLYSYCFKPIRCATFWRDYELTGVKLCNLSMIGFPQIKWEDKEPTSREEILGE